MTSFNRETKESVQESTEGEIEPSLSKFALWMYGHTRRVIIFVVGSTVLLIGIAMIVLPGPAIVVIPIGLGILATEFVWARRWLAYAKKQLELLTAAATKQTQSPDSKQP